MKRRHVFLWFMAFVAVAAEEAEGEEEKPDKSAYSMGLTMLGMAVLITFLYRLTHAKRQETREISWKLISGTVSIFVGVVVFSSLNDLFEMIFLPTSDKDVEKDTEHEYNFKTWLNRFWVFTLYCLFLFFISKKAKLGLPGTSGSLKERLEIIEDKGVMVCRKCKRIQPEQKQTTPLEDTKCQFCKHRGCQLQAKIFVTEWAQNSTWGKYVAHFNKAREIYLMEEPEFVKGGHTSMKNVLCNMKGSLFWAHAIGFAGIEGWNMTQQHNCKGETEGDCAKSSLILILRALFQYYVMLRFVGVFWRFIMKKRIEPKCFNIVRKEKRADHPEPLYWVLKARKSLKDGPEVWLPLYQEEGEIIGKKQEFQRKFVQDGEFYQFRYEFEEEEGEEEEEGKTKQKQKEEKEGKAYFHREVNGAMSNTFPAPTWWQYKFKVGQDCQAVPEYDELVEQWDDIRKDGENDFFALAMSFLVVQTLRLLLGHHLPDKEEDEYLFQKGHSQGHSILSALALYLIGFLCLVSAFFAYAMLARAKEKPLFFKKGECCHYVLQAIHRCESQLLRDEFHETIERSLEILVDVLCMSASWSALYGTQWLLARWEYVTMQDSAVLTVMLAVTITFVMFLGLFTVDFYLDTPSNRHHPPSTTPSSRRFSTATEPEQRDFQELRRTHKGAFRKIQTSVGLLIGFAWEADFDEAVDKIAETIAPEHQVIFKTLCAGVFLFLLLPVWFGQIIPMSEEQGWKFGFIPRRVHARMTAIQTDLDANHPDGDEERANAHEKHIEEHRPHLAAISEKLSKVLLGVKTRQIEFIASEREAHVEPEPSSAGLGAQSTPVSPHVVTLGDQSTPVSPHVVTLGNQSTPVSSHELTVRIEGVQTARVVHVSGST